MLENPDSSKQFLQAFAAVKGPKILVHGGGRLADQYLLRLGLQPRMINGRRVTDKDTLDVVTMVYAGLVNKQLVALLHTLGCQGVGLTGADGNLIRSRKRSVRDVDWGFVGDPEQVDCTLIEALLEKNKVPVIAPLTHDHQGTLLNTNADTMASVLAVALTGSHQVTLTFAFDKPGVLLDVNDDASVIPVIDEVLYEDMKAKAQVHSGMLPKLDSAFEGLKKGIGKIRIVGFASISDPEAGTTLLLKK